MSHYQHLTIDERESIQEMKLKGFSCRKIAEILKRSVSTISRELKRNSVNGRYRPSRAQKKYQARRKNCRRRYMLEAPALKEKVLHLLTKFQWSPEQIAGRLKREKSLSISYNTIYRALEHGRLEPPGTRRTKKGKRYPLEKHLRRKGKNYVGRKCRSQGFVTKTIDQRPKAADSRSRFGHWEGDTVYCSHYKTYIITLVDRRSRYLLTACCKSKKPKEVAEVMIKMLSVLPPKLVQSITLDRGCEFAQHAMITQALPHVQCYFADPMSPWQRGTNENTNGLLRQYVPKESYTTPFSEELLKTFTDKLNHRPRKCLGWKSPFEVFFHRVLHLT